jgi:integrase
VYVAYLAFLTTGMRLGEMFSLSWTKVMFDQNLIMVSATWDNALRKVKEVT